MANFQTIVLSIAAFILIVILIIMAYVIMKSKNSQRWPPNIGDCPDYWEDQRDPKGAKGSKCVNIKGLGKNYDENVIPSSPFIMDFSGAAYVGSQGLCNKYKWAKGYEVTWDGITSGVSNPCDITDTTGNV